MNWDLLVIFGFVLLLVGMRGWFALQGGGRDRSLSAADGAALERAREDARRLEERIDALERVLDEDMPGWRRKLAS